MRQEDMMVLKQNYAIIRPPVYELQIAMWNWCKLSEVCAIIPEVAARAGEDFSPTAEELVNLFAAAVRPNRGSIKASPGLEASPKAKIFRYSKTGAELCGTKVPTEGPRPPDTLFVLDVGTPYPPDLFVPEGWAIDVIKAIRLGAVAAANHGDKVFGLVRRESGNTSFALDGSMWTTTDSFPR